MEHGSLKEDWIFKTILTLSFIISLLSTIIIVSNNQYYFCSETNCFSNLLVIFKLPISIFTGGMALSALRALIVRSHQTAVQIHLTIQQNLFSNYYKHLEEFEKYIELNTDKLIFFRSKRELHSYLFPDSRESGIKENKEFINIVNSQVLNIEKQVISLTSNPYHSENEIRVTLSNIDKSLSKLRDIVGMRVKEARHFKLCENNIVDAVRMGFWDQVYDRTYFTLNAIEMISKFEQSFKPIEALNKICNHDRKQAWHYNESGTEYNLEAAKKRINEITKLKSSSQI
ncbi:hypothetical protein OA92_13195 [Marinomonas sp. SBI22]|uniref:hypothetical protein n=1 Tax=unclassified Marinomonas TaxID=196814 RepID=UPI0007AF73BD|nr:MULTISPECIES: hypothetical protein [unclassified Marinomonas]KZM42154.1 hypothetical protein OA92_13195 [Marinomonas sp. SBI22]KZM47002.1 hypothetical protein OA91_00210 [Marinomonas sp. SBI8L]